MIEACSKTGGASILELDHFHRYCRALLSPGGASEAPAHFFRPFRGLAGMVVPVSPGLRPGLDSSVPAGLAGWEMELQPFRTILYTNCEIGLGLNVRTD